MPLCMTRVTRLASISLLALAACAVPPTKKPIVESTTSLAVTQGGDDPTAVAPDATSTPASGAADPLVVVTVFTDFQCPACPRVESFMEGLREFWPDDVQIQYRHFPLMNSHPLAHSAAQAVAAAHRQGGFACMAHALYTTQDAWTNRIEDTLREHVHTLAGECGLDAPSLVADMEDESIIARVDEDFRLGREAGVRGTPWVLVNGIRANLSPRDGIQPATLLKALVRRELREARVKLELGMKRSEIPKARLFGNLADAALVERLLDQ